ncbi:hypothetical protein TgHK011_006755 [Trichoderma gracile]|nr:hypothetical protein TgHK011_006755 [Trichoderma gracile]
MDDGCIDSNEPIFELASECEQLFSQHLSRLKDEADTNAAKAVGEFQQRFSAWAAFLGVFAVPELCLDRKLQHHAEIQDLVLRLLDVMKRNLTYLFEARDSPKGGDVEPADFEQASPLDTHLRISMESLRGIEGAIERLHHLGGTIQLSSEASQAVRIGKFATRLDSSSFEQFTRLAIASFYPEASSSLLEHLARAMADMYHKYHYRRSRRARLQPRPPVILSPINEESSSFNQPKPWTADAVGELASPTMTFHRQRPPPIVRSHLGARSHQSRDSKPTSLDSLEFKRQFFKNKDGSVKSKTRSIVATQMAYPPQSADSLLCDWCFSPLSENESKGENWRKHLNEDFKPFVCISENCSEPLNRFATSRAWFSHMLEAPDLAEHLVKLHSDVFTTQQVQVIVHQSRLRAPRSQDICPLCCLSMTDGQAPGEGEGNHLKQAIPASALQDDRVYERHKRIKTEAGAKRPDQKSDTNSSSAEQMAPELQAPSFQDQPPLPFEDIAKHVASHLQGIMLLTLRMMALEFSPEIPADDQSLSGGTDDCLSRFGSTRQSSQHGALGTKMTDEPWTQDDSKLDIDDPVSEDSIPDCELDVDWQDVMLNDELSPEADIFLQQVIDSGAFQTKDRQSTSDDAAIDTRQPRRLHPQRGVIISLPFRRDPLFTGHKSLLHNLIQRCSSPPSRVVLVGLGGMGKSHLAIELAHRIVLSADTSVFWIRADTPSSIEEGLGGIVSNAISRRHSTDSLSALAYDWLSDERNGRWLIILDGVTENSLTFLQDKTSLLQSQTGTVLATTRHKKVGQSIAGNRNNVFEMKPMAIFDAVALLGRKLGRSGNNSWRGPRSTSDLVKSLGLSPLTICRASAYIQSMPAPEDEERDNGEGKIETNGDEDGDEALYLGAHAVYPGNFSVPEMTRLGLVSFDVEGGGEKPEEEGEQKLNMPNAQPMMARKFKQLLHSEQERTKLLEFEPSSSDGSGETHDSILTIWQTSFRAVRAERSSAADLLALMSFFDRRGIPKWLLNLPRRNDPRLHKGASGIYDVDADIETLLNHCLISSNGTKDIFSMHGLMQLAVKRSINHTTRHTYEYLFVMRLEEAFPRDVYSNWTTCEELFAHAQVAASRQPTSDYLSGYWTSLLYHAARFARARGNYEVAMTMADQVVKARSHQRTESMETPVASSLIALILMDQGSYDKAEGVFTQVANVCKDGNFFTRLTSMHNLACIYKLRGRWKEAEEILGTVSMDRRKNYGEDHPWSLSSLANLASLRRAQGRYHEAHIVLLRVFEGYTGKFGLDHPRTLASMNDLGSICRLLGMPDEAERYQKQAYETRKIFFGSDHPDTLASMNSLASTYRVQGRLDEAEALQDQTLEGRKRILGPDHPSTLASMNNLALILNDQGKHGVASKLQSQVSDACKEKLGTEHPHTLTALNNLALIWRNKVRHGVSRWTMEECAEARRRVLGPEHPYTVSSARIAETWASEDKE